MELEQQKGGVLSPNQNKVICVLSDAGDRIEGGMVVVVLGEEVSGWMVTDGWHAGVT